MIGNKFYFIFYFYYICLGVYCVLLINDDVILMIIIEIIYENFVGSLLL